MKAMFNGITLTPELQFKSLVVCVRGIIWYFVSSEDTSEDKDAPKKPSAPVDPEPRLEHTAALLYVRCPQLLPSCQDSSLTTVDLEKQRTCKKIWWVLGLFNQRFQLCMLIKLSQACSCSTVAKSREIHSSQLQSPFVNVHACVPMPEHGMLCF